MKLERMLAIIMYLSGKEKVKAQELAEKMEVSVRTIYRDIEAISCAGIPITTFQGANGGLGIVEGYKIDKSVLSNEEILSILAGLKGLHSINKDQKTKLLIEKLSGVTENSDYMPAGNEIAIDLSSWNKNDRLHLRINEIKKAIRLQNIIRFTYYAYGKLTERKVEPCVIIFKESNWYLYGYCLLRNDFRLFKLRRISQLEITDEIFVMRDYSIEKFDINGDIDGDKGPEIVLLFEKSMTYAVDDIFGIDNYEVMEDGKIKVRFNMGIGDWLYGFVLGFGGNVEVIEPLTFKENIIAMAEDVLKKYRRTE
ncbi:helix-turn-helix transcriptional regulator [Pseudobacteroides cellulosolvens]|uniref:WYL domain containing protein n=1 Tax=Pseudobacteroides cellulosolvens ATCC 35603 = DSM 2933 TaxID=398512 RepID=A0A0L6JRE5_9FIRM|nr:YafY family protein [Pseudobacteroides cellulosolvens]KNY27967.1 WYL domain containing protein [Pseudobacteroides cellulosolvens ATCC 35603 = DSM 2933]